MWPRAVEVMLGCWLGVSPFVFGHAPGETRLWWNDLGVGLLVVTISLVSFSRRAGHAHLLNALVALWLIGFGYLGFGDPPPPAAQNYLVVGLVLLMLAIIPSEATRPPKGWRSSLASAPGGPAVQRGAGLRDISLLLGPRLPIWPDNPGLELRPAIRISQGGSANVSELRIGTHTGTHVDAPGHFLEGGAAVDRLPLDALIGQAWVADLSASDHHVGAADLEALGLPQGVERLLLRTRNSARWRDADGEFTEDFVGVLEDAAGWVVERGIRLLGVDGLSLEPFGTPGSPAHHRLLRAGVVVVEGLDLHAVEAGRYVLACLPLKLEGADGSPMRAVLWAEEGSD